MSSSSRALPRRPLGLAILLLANFAAVARAQDSHDDHEDMPFEWGGAFATPESEYTWVAQQVDGAYADPSMVMVALPAADTLEATFETLEEVAEGLFEAGSCTEVEHTQTIVANLTACYELHFEEPGESRFAVDTSATSNVVFFAAHVPTEFESDTHYFLDCNFPLGICEDVEPAMQETFGHTEESAGDGKPWGKAIGASFLVLLCTLCGIIFLVPIAGKAKENNENAFVAVTSAFAAGAILACAFYLILYEATHYVGGYWNDEEVDGTWRWGTATMAGIVSPWFLHTLANTLLGGRLSKTVGDNAVSPTGVDVEEESVKQSAWVRLCVGVLVGDFLHNFVDGILIAFAFQLCSDSKGWAVTAGAVGHEIAQEIGDYVVLTGPAGFSPAKALGLNFLSGLSVIFGAIAYLSQDIDNGSQGVLLAFGGGSYIAIGAVECLPRVFESAKTPKLSWACFLAFVVGAVAIGLVLLDHEHCVPEDASADPHGGHNH